MMVMKWWAALTGRRSAIIPTGEAPRADYCPETAGIDSDQRTRVICPSCKRWFDISDRLSASRLRCAFCAQEWTLDSSIDGLSGQHREIPKAEVQTREIKKNTEPPIDIKRADGRGIISIDAKGVDLFSIMVSIKNLSNDAISIEIPAGRTFNGRGIFQNMAVALSTVLSLEPLQSKIIQVPAVCVNARLRVPNSRDSFSGFSSRESEFVSHMVTKYARIDRVILQIAIWIITDHIDMFEAMKLFGGDSEILNKYTAAQALLRGPN
jgi:hypothetical protein